jgi:hypothetical protein
LLQGLSIRARWLFIADIQQYNQKRLGRPLAPPPFERNHLLKGFLTENGMPFGWARSRDAEAAI